MTKVFDRIAFILGMKKNKYHQALGKLFILAEDGDLYACAMGQGALDVGVVSEEEVRRTLKPKPLTTWLVMKDGQQGTILGRTSYDLETNVQRQLKESLGGKFWERVVRLNDKQHLPVPEIGAQIRADVEAGSV